MFSLGPGPPSEGVVVERWLLQKPWVARKQTKSCSGYG
jgi:hypothetical protein